MIKVYLNRNQLFKSNPIHNELLDPSVGYFIVDYKLLYILVSLYHFRRGRGKSFDFFIPTAIYIKLARQLANGLEP